MGGRVFELGNPKGRGAQTVLEIQVGGGVKKPCLLSWGCGFFLEQPILLLEFSGLKQYNKYCIITDLNINVAMATMISNFALQTQMHQSFKQEKSINGKQHHQGFPNESLLF